MDPAIAEIVSKAFYDGKLDTVKQRRDEAESKSAPFIHLKHLPASPIVVVDFPHVNATGQRQGLERSRPRWHNPSEIDSVVDVLRSVRAGDGEKKPTLAVLSPYSAQVERLSERIGAAIRKGELAHLRDFRSVRDDGQGFVGTVDSFQGSEADLVVMSLVRNNEGSGSSALGFLRDRRRMNVAISRAKWKLVFVGSLHFLEEAVRGVNPGDEKEKHELGFITKMIGEIRSACDKRRNGVPLASIIRPDALRTPR
jgi:superfamily I DNA and/or RNA helicase